MFATVRRTAAVTLALVPLTLAACGDDGLDRTALATKANALCKRQTDAAAKLSRETGVITEAKADAYFKQTTALVRELQHELAALRPNGEVQDDWKAYIDVTDRGMGLLEQFTASKGKDRDEKNKELMRIFTALSPQLTAAAKKVGVTSCAGGAPPA